MWLPTVKMQTTDEVEEVLDHGQPTPLIGDGSLVAFHKRRLRVLDNGDAATLQAAEEHHLEGGALPIRGMQKAPYERS